MGLDQYAYERTDDTGEEGSTAKFVWRKHARLQEFMETLFEEKTGGDPSDLNCGELQLAADDIDQLEAKVKGEGLPESPGGFFFGHQFQDEQAAHYKDQDLAFCSWAKEAMAGGATVCFSCWW